MELNHTLKYITFNLEVGENSTPHLQMHAITPTQLTATAWQKALGGCVGNIVPTDSPFDCRDYWQGFTVKSDRIERKAGSQDANLASDSGYPGYEEYGIHTVSGSTDLTKAIDFIKAGSSVRYLIDIMPGIVNGAYRMLTDYHKESCLLTARTSS